ncbi:MAG: hypothetical protein HYY76_11905 [Acidobacteria bacterium]|nr:hypothetical protein [Acidobacteriota bacterium]
MRRRAAGPVGRYRGARIRHRLAALASSGRPILAGPWLGEVGFEILYWAPFLRWFASEFHVPPERLAVLSRGGTWSWYAPIAGRYYEVFDYVQPDVVRQWREAHVGEAGEQKQTRLTQRERQLLDRVRASLPAATAVLHPSVMYDLMNPFWWRHLDEDWIHRHTRYQRLERPPRMTGLNLPERYVAAKFYFNDCFPATEENRAFVRAELARLADRGPVVSLSAGVAIDDHGACAVTTYGVVDMAGTAPPSQNLHVQSAIVAHADAFVGTYGGFAYLAPFYGVRSTSYYGDADGFSRSHLQMAASAFTAIGARDLLQVFGV